MRISLSCTFSPDSAELSRSTLERLLSSKPRIPAQIREKMQVAPAIQVEEEKNNIGNDLCVLYVKRLFFIVWMASVRIIQ